jgi:hypothetical protein
MFENSSGLEKIGPKSNVKSSPKIGNCVTRKQKGRTRTDSL